MQRQRKPGRGQSIPASVIAEWARNNPLDAAAVATAPIPLVGDVVGGAADVKGLLDEPSWMNAGMLAAGLIPFVPAGTVKRVGEGLLSGGRGYHGSNIPDIKALDPAKAKRTTPLGSGVYLSPHEAIAKRYGDNIYAADYSGRGLDFDELTPDQKQELAEKLREIVPTDRMAGFGEVRKEYIDTTDPAAASARFEELSQQTSGAYHDRAKAVMDEDEGGVFIQYMTPSLENASGRNLADLVAEYAPELPKNLGYDWAKAGDEVAVYNKDALKMADDLPLDEASRAQRARDMGMDKDLYHGTHSDFTEVDPDKVDLGIHLGTAEQANNRLKSLSNPFAAGRSGALRAGANVMPVKARINNPLELKDVGLWNNSMDVASELNRKGLIPDDLYQEISDVRYSYEDLEDFIDGPENREFLDEIRRNLQDQGYDGIKYKNEVENEYGNLSSMTDEAKELRRYYGDKLQKIELNVSDRMPAPPDPSDPNAVALLEEFLAAPRDWKSYATPEELAEWEDLAGKFRAIDADPASFADPHSYIAFEPNQVRSRFAKFDPFKADSADLLAGVAGLGVTGLLGSQLMGDEERQY